MSNKEKYVTCNDALHSEQNMDKLVLHIKYIAKMKIYYITMLLTLSTEMMQDAESKFHDCHVKI